MDSALKAGYIFDFNFELDSAKKSIVETNYNGLYIANLCFKKGTREEGLDLATFAQRQSIPVLVQICNAGDKEMVERRNIEMIDQAQVIIRGNKYLIERFGQVFGAKLGLH